jgi:small-conductance mechanosensitive channel
MLCSRINLSGFKNRFWAANFAARGRPLYLRLRFLKFAAFLALLVSTVPAFAATERAHGAPAEVPSTQAAHTQFVFLRGLAERFSNYIDVLALQFSGVLGGWSRQPVFFTMTPAKILLLLLTFVAGCVLALLARFIILKCHALGRVKPITERYWRNGILFALRRSLTVIFIFTGAFFAAVPILPHIGFAVGGFPTFAIAAKVAGLGYFAALLGFCLRIVRLVQHWLVGLTERSPSRWYDGAFPVLGKALQYNVLLGAALATVYILQLPDSVQKVAYQVVSTAGIIANTILAIQTVAAVESMMTSRSEALRLDVYKRRRFETRNQMVRRLLVFIIIVVGIAATLLNFQPVRQIGTGLLASAGVAGVIAGLAAQKSLSTIIAGLQVAITQPIRIDDHVIVEGEWGTIEEITLTYVVVRVWDQRRLIAPITYFLEKSFQNWTRNSSDLIGVVFLYVDFVVPVEEIRKEARRIVEQSKIWDRRVFAFQVTDFRSDSVEIRILATAGSAPEAFDLRCEIRESLLSFLQSNYPNSFPRVRNSLMRQSPGERPGHGNGEMTERVRTEAAG